MADISVKVKNKNEKNQHILIFHVNSFNHINTRGPQKLVKIIAYANTSVKFYYYLLL